MRRRADPHALLSGAIADALPRARFRRRIPIGPYIGEFVSTAAKLVVEIDHGDRGGIADAARTRFLNRQGYRLIRFWDRDVLHDVRAILDAIACALPPECLEDDGPACRISGPAARAEWSPRPDLPVSPRSPAEMHQ